MKTRMPPKFGGKYIMIGCALMMSLPLANGFESNPYYGPSEQPCAEIGSQSGVHTFTATYIEEDFPFPPTEVTISTTTPEIVSFAPNSIFCLGGFGEDGPPDEPPSYFTCYVDYEYEILLPPAEPGLPWVYGGIAEGGPEPEGSLTQQDCSTPE